MIHHHLAAEIVVLYVGTRSEGLCRTFRQTPVATSHLHTGKAQLTGHPLRQQVTVVVGNETPTIGDTLSDGDVFVVAATFHDKETCIVGTLGRSIDVDDVDMVALDTGQFVTACCNEPYRQVEVVQQKDGHRCGIAAAGHLVANEEVIDGLQVLSDSRRHDVQAAS